MKIMALLCLLLGLTACAPPAQISRTQNILPELPTTPVARAGVKAPFDYRRAAWLPERLRLIDVDASDLPQAIRLIYGSPKRNDDRLIVETHQAPLEEHRPYPATAVQQVTIQGQPATCVRGGWSKQGYWRGGVVESALAWEAEGMHYRITQVGLGLNCEALVHVATGPPPPTPTPTPVPTPVPLTQEAIASCPTSLPNLKESQTPTISLP